MTAIQNRYEFVYFFDVENGNPNGDPDAGNMPRIDPENGYGLVTDVCLKRKVRNYVDIVKENESPYEIHVREGAFLSEHHKRAHRALDSEKLYISLSTDLHDEFSNFENFPEGIGFEEGYIYLRLGADVERAKKDVGKIKNISDAAKSKLKELFVDSKEVVAKKWMCKNFYDVRTFGAVMSTGDKTCGQVRGPVQLSFAKSVDPIIPIDISMSRTAAVSVDNPDDKGLGARKSIVPYGLYCVQGFVSAPFAGYTGFSETDLDLLWQALENMFDHDHSAARGKMNARGLVIFKHDSKLGNAPAHKLLDLVKVERATDPNIPARSFSDYKVTVDEANVPQGVTLENKI